MLSKLKNNSFLIVFIVFVFTGIINQNVLVADSGVNQADPYLAFAEQMPEVEGGLPNLYKTIKYPEIARKAGITGKVFVMAFINESGDVEDVQVIKGIGGGCDEAAVEAIKKAKFVPGKNNGQAVKVKLSLPISFQLQ
ncbi:MAG: energy transducer TonB [Ignavibacteriales bacterium]|jgi:protein TonB|nr:MAG: energy transducer TonB [Ignavibacteriales bacterium]